MLIKIGYQKHRQSRFLLFQFDELLSLRNEETICLNSLHWSKYNIIITDSVDVETSRVPSLFLAHSRSTQNVYSILLVTDRNL